MELSTSPLSNGSLQNNTSIAVPNHLKPIYNAYVNIQGVHAAEIWLNSYLEKQSPNHQTTLPMSVPPVKPQNAPRSDSKDSIGYWEASTESKGSKAVWRSDLEKGMLDFVKSMFNPLYSAYRLFKLLYENAKRYAIKQGWSCKVSHVSFFCPIEIIATSLGVNRTTIWRSCKKLQGMGLIEARPHYTTVDHDSTGKAVNRIDGTVWNIKMQKDVSDAKLSHEDLHSQYRDLRKDIESGETAFNISQNRQMQQSNTSKEDMFDIELVENFTLPPLKKINPVIYDCCTSGSSQNLELDTILNLPHIEDEVKRREGVENAAQSICAAINDSHSFKFFCKFLWCLIRHKEHEFSQEANLFISFYTEVRRVKSEAQEGAVKKPGALLVSRLKRWKWWEQIVRDTPKTTVCRFMKA